MTENKWMPKPTINVNQFHFIYGIKYYTEFKIYWLQISNDIKEFMQYVKICKMAYLNAQYKLYYVDSSIYVRDHKHHIYLNNLDISIQ